VRTDDPNEGVDPKILRCQEDAANGCERPDLTACPRGGWILTPFDTWVACGIHGPGEHHPEDPPQDEDDGWRYGDECLTDGERNPSINDTGRLGDR